MSKNTTIPSAPRGQAREALRRRQQQQAAAQKRLRTIVRTAWIAGITVIALIVGVMVWAVAGARSSSTALPASGEPAVPAFATPAGAIQFGKTDAKTTVSVYADYMCPFCGRFERANGESLQRLVAAGTVRLEIHPMAFLDSQSAGSKYSTRAANAFVTIANTDPAAALRFNQLLFANQPTEGSSGLTDPQLAALAGQAGAAQEVVASFGRQAYAPWVAQLTQKAFDAGVTGTPTVKINGQVFTGDLYTPGALDAAIRQASGA